MEKIYKGAQFEVTEDIDTDGLLHWHAAFTGGFRCVIPKGTILVTFQDCSASLPRSVLYLKTIRDLNESTFYTKTHCLGEYASTRFVFARSEAGRRLRLSDSHP